jgi:hypothetical protein
MWGMGQFEPIGNRVFMTQRRQTMGHKNLFVFGGKGILAAQDREMKALERA